MKITQSQLRRIIREEAAGMGSGRDPQRFLHGFESGHPHDDEGYMVKSRMADLKEMAADICDLLDSGDQLPGWVQNLVATAHSDLQHVHDYLMNDEKMRGRSPKSVSLVKVAESRRRQDRVLSESHARITPNELRAWMNGDWGYLSEDDDELSH